MIFEDSKVWKDIISSENGLNVAYQTDTGIIINNNNFEYIFYIELQKLNFLKDITEEQRSMLTQKIKDNIYNNIEKPYLKTEFITISKENKFIYKEIEQMKNFYKWLII